MTPLFLQDALVQEVGQILSGLKTATGGAFQVYPQHMPPRDTEGDTTIFPFCRVWLGEGEDNDEAVQELVVVVAVRDPDKNMQGYRDVFNAIQRIRERYKKNPYIAETYQVQSMKWGMDTEDLFPAFYGAVSLQVSLPQIDVVSDLT